MKTTTSTWDSQRYYTEQEAAAALRISIGELHTILDRHVFNDGTLRPANLTFLSSDLVLLKYWRKQAFKAEVIEMRRRF